VTANACAGKVTQLLYALLKHDVSGLPVGVVDRCDCRA
jgi:hypothetical protein